VLPEELLSFLLVASEYYLHPVGEVLRAAAPAMPADAMRALQKGGLLPAGERLPGSRIATRRAMRVRPAEGRMSDPGLRLGARQTQLWDLIRAQGESTLDSLRAAVPSARAVVRALEEKGLVETEEREVVGDPFFLLSVERDIPKQLLPAQTAAVTEIVGAVSAAQARSFLLHGVTGSGKTEVYLQCIAEARARDRGAILLVPEISLTPQLVARFRARFGDEIAVLHSGLTDRQRNDAWRGLRTGALRLAVGARSALFAPIHSLGVVVVDEEHDPSFKQEEGFRYHARDMAMLRAQRAGAVCVLGSATP